MADTFCNKCASWTESFAKAGEEEIADNAFHSWAAVKASADQGCSLCQIVYQSAYYYPDIADLKGSSPIRVGISKRSREFSLLVRSEAVWIFFPLPVVADTSDEARFNNYKERCKGILNPTASGSLDSIAGMASEWLQKCRQSHCRCNASHNPDQEKILPTRLIDVGLDSQQPKLINPDHDLLHLEYVILSYAWGTVADFAKTTASNVEAMNQSLPWCGLPKTVQEAILLTRKSGVRCLWVDALCILQSEGPNDVRHMKDWSYEAERFGHYHQNALLTVSATGAISSHEGLLLPRPDLVLSPKSVTLQHIDVTLRSFIPSWESEMDFPPLASRGWASQERFLSNRILHSGPNLILWECHELSVSELDPEGLDPKGLDGRSGFNSSTFLSTFKNLESDEISLDLLMDQWLEFISIYSRAEFSYYSDRLPALSGIASIIRKRIGKKYIAGLWEPGFTRGLLWVGGTPKTDHVSDIANLETEERQLNIPSWSWAASRQCVFFPDLPNWKSMYEIEDCVTTSIGSETSGQLLSWRLKLWGSFALLNLSEMGFERHGKARINLFVSFCGSAPMVLCLDGFIGPQIPYTSCPCLLVGIANRVSKDREDDEDEKTAYALVLESTGQSSVSVEKYRRIGTLETSFRDWKTKVQCERTIEVV